MYLVGAWEEGEFPALPLYTLLPLVPLARTYDAVCNQSCRDTVFYDVPL